LEDAENTFKKEVKANEEKPVSERLYNAVLAPQEASAHAVVNQAYSKRLLGFSVIACLQIFLWPWASELINQGVPVYSESSLLFPLLYVGLIFLISTLLAFPIFKGHSRFLLHIVFGVYAISQMVEFDRSGWQEASFYGLMLIVLTGSLVFIRLTDFSFTAAVILFGLVAFPGLPWGVNPELSSGILMATNLVICVVFGATALNWRNSPVSERIKWQLEELEKAWRDFFWNNPSPILITDINTRIVEANPALCKLLNYSHEQLTKMRIAEIQLVEEKTNSLKQVKEGFQSGTIRVDSVGWLTKSGKLLDLKLNGALVKTIYGQFLQVFVEESHLEKEKITPLEESAQVS